MRPDATTVAVIGYGRIGSRVGAALRAIGFQVLVHDPLVDPERIVADGHQPAELDAAAGRGRLRHPARAADARRRIT